MHASTLASCRELLADASRPTGRAWPTTHRRPITRRRSPRSSRSTAPAATTTTIARGSSRSRATRRCRKGRRTARRFKRRRRRGEPDDPPVDRGREAGDAAQGGAAAERRGDRDCSRPGSTSGASGPQGEPADRLALVVPKIASHAKVRPVTALDASRDGRWLAIARYAVGRAPPDRRATGPPRRHAPARARRLPRQGHGRAFHGRRHAGW